VLVYVECVTVMRIHSAPARWPDVCCTVLLCSVEPSSLFGGLGVLRGQWKPSRSAGIEGRDKYMVSSVDIAVLTLKELARLFATRVSDVLLPRLPVPAGPIESRTVAPVVDDPRCLADQDMTVGQVSSPLPCCGTIRVGHRPQRARRSMLERWQG
jgi:hypothetical protein